MKALSIFLAPFLLLSLFGFVAVAQQQDTSAINRILSASDGLHRLRPLEKVYVHTDRNSYLIGDTIWFKAYVFDANSLTSTKNSALLFLELHDDQSEVVRRLSIKIKDGIGYAQVSLPKEIFKEGGHTLRAYTNWMNNFDPEQTFRKRIYIGKANEDSWLISSDITTRSQNDGDELNAKIAIHDIDENPVGLRNVLIEIAEGEKNRYRKTFQTDMKGNLHFDYKLRKDADQRNMSILIHDLRKDAPPQTIQIPLTTKRNSSIDLQFLPEGGNLVAGLTSRLAFKAITDDGKGTDVEGIIVNQDNKRVGSFSSLHKGMGSFTFQPKDAEKYVARITKPEGVKQSFSLPVIQPAGTVLHVENDYNQDSIAVSVSATPGAVDSTVSLAVIGSSNGVIYFAQKIDLTDNTIKLAKQLFPSGIVKFSLLKDSIPLNERIIFIDHQDDLTVNIESDKQNEKDTIKLQIKVSDALGKPVAGTFSLSITDNGVISADTAGNFDIRTNLLLNAELKGEVENPGYYFTSFTEHKSQSLDYLMLTQGWVGHQWKDVFHPPMLKVLSEKPGNVVHIKQMLFHPSPFTRLKPWYLNGDSSKFLFAKSATLYDDYWSADGTMLKEVKIRGSKRDYTGYNRNGTGYANIVLDSTDLQLSKTKGLYDLLRQKVAGLTIEHQHIVMSNKKGYNLRIGKRWVSVLFPNGTAMLYMKKTPQETKDAYNAIKVNSFKMVEILYTDRYLNAYYPPKLSQPFKPGATHKYIESRAKAGMAPEPVEEQLNALVIISGHEGKRKNANPLSVEHPRQFYIPRFDSKSTTPVLLPATVFWEPDILTDKAGRATLSFYSRGMSGNFTVNLQGADMLGNVGSNQIIVTIQNK